MSEYVLGISAFYHDSAAALLKDGTIVAACQEERLSRKKHDSDFPTHAVKYVLREAGIGPEQLDAVGFYDKPLLKFERMLSTYIATFPKSFGSFRKAMPVWIKEKLFVPYFSTKATGMGLGLPIVHQIVTDHGGTIWVEDNPPRGSRFVIELPGARMTAPAAVPA